MAMKNFLTMAALALVGAIMAGCSGSDDIIDDAPQPATQKDNIVTMKTTVGLDGGGETRALSPTGVKTFAVGETMAVFFTNTEGYRIALKSHALTAKDITNNGKSATFTFDFVHPLTHCEPDTNEKLQYVYPAARRMQHWNLDHVVLETIYTLDLYKSQTGSLEKLGQEFDLTTYEGYWGVDGNLPSATLENQLAILAINLKNADGTKSITKDLTEVVINIENGKSYIVRSDYTFGQDVIYVGIIPTGKDVDVTVTATDDTKFYTKTLTGKSYEQGHGYNVSWRMTEVDLEAIPLTIQVILEGSVVVNNPREGMKYSLNGGTKITMSGTTTINVNAGDKVQFYGNGKSISAYWASESDYTSIGYTDDLDYFKCKVYGNIMSLVDEDDFATNTTLPADNTFRGLFSGNTMLTDVRNLLLPATTLSNYCYQNMFYGCVLLTETPVLPATTLSNYCYAQMFQDCTDLVMAPELPAKDLEEGCYMGMFQGCMNLETAPELPATTLSRYCYAQMFQGCAILTETPVLPAEELTEGCYQFMFQDCESLESVTCLAFEGININGSTTNWLSGVASEGTFYKAARVRWPTRSPDGIPVGWEEEEYEE